MALPFEDRRQTALASISRKYVLRGGKDEGEKILQRALGGAFGNYLGPGLSLSWEVARPDPDNLYGQISGVGCQGKGPQKINQGSLRRAMRTPTKCD